MKYLIPVLVGGAAITAGVTTAIAQAHRVFNGDVSLTPYLYAYGAAALLLLLAVVLAISASRQESKTQAPPPPTVHQENKQTVTQEFYLGPRAVAVEPDETAQRIRAFMKSAHPHTAYTADEIAKEFNLTTSRAWGELKKQQAEGWVRPNEADQGTLWIFYDKEL